MIISIGRDRSKKKPIINWSMCGHQKRERVDAKQTVTQWQRTDARGHSYSYYVGRWGGNAGEEHSRRIRLHLREDWQTDCDCWTDSKSVQLLSANLRWDFTIVYNIHSMTTTWPCIPLLVVTSVVKDIPPTSRSIWK